MKAVSFHQSFHRFLHRYVFNYVFESYFKDDSFSLFFFILTAAESMEIKIKKPTNSFIAKFRIKKLEAFFFQFFFLKCSKESKRNSNTKINFSIFVFCDVGERRSQFGSLLVLGLEWEVLLRTGGFKPKMLKVQAERFSRKVFHRFILLLMSTISLRQRTKQVKFLIQKKAKQDILSSKNYATT